MKQMLKGYLSLCALFSVIGFTGTTVANDVRIRSQSVDTARELSGWTNHVNLYDMGGIYGSFAITPEYTQSFHGRQIARSLFGNAITNNSSTTTNGNCNSGCNDNSASFRVSGSTATGRVAGDLLADYFGLPTDYQSTVTVRPEIQNFLVDFDFFIGLDEWLCGLWFRIHAPVVYAKWKLRMDEVQSVTAAAAYPAGYFAPAAVPVADLNTSFVSYLQGNVPTLNGGVTFAPLKYDKLCGSGNVSTSTTTNGCCSNSCNSGAHTTRLSDIRFALGWNFWQDEDYHVGLGILAAAPTGNRVNDTFLFQPFVGNGHHWELGGKFTSHYTFWRSCDYDRSFGFYLDIDVTHLFATRQFRSFDLCGAGDNSKYMLAESLLTPSVGLFGATAITPAPGLTASTYQFDGVFTPIANLATQNVKVSQNVQVDLSAMFNYTHCGFAWDLGYNFWMTSCEKIKQCGNTSALFSGNTTYALKGDASVYGFTAAAPTGPIALGATESAATICSGTNILVGVTPAITPTTSINAGVDNAQFANNTAGVTPLYNSSGAAAPADQTHTSIQSVLLSNANIDVASATAKGMSNKVFTHLSYTWEDHDCYVPYFGVGGKAEFASDKKNCNVTGASCTNSSGCTVANNIVSTSSCSSSCNDNNCRRTNISEWGIWLKGGVSFN